MFVCLPCKSIFAGAASCWACKKEMLGRHKTSITTSNPVMTHQRFPGQGVLFSGYSFKMLKCQLATEVQLGIQGIQNCWPETGNLTLACHIPWRVASPAFFFLPALPAAGCQVSTGCSVGAHWPRSIKVSWLMLDLWTPQKWLKSARRRLPFSSPDCLICFFK